MTNRLLELATWVVIWTVLALPVAGAESLLTVQRFSGVDKVNGFAKENDELTVKVLAQMIGNPTPDVARQRVRVHYEDTYSFADSCTAQQQAMYECSYKTTDLSYGGTDDYAIKLYDAENKEVASVDRRLTIDFLAPKIVLFTVSPNMTARPTPTKITYKVEDYGSETGKMTNCAGMKLLNITANGVSVGIISGNVTQCVRDGTFTFTPQVAGDSARVRVCAVATDHLNHQSLPACKDVLIDSRKPTPEALELRDKDGFVLAHMRTTQQLVADVFVKISDIDVKPSTVFADLSKLNPALGRVPKSEVRGEWFVWKNVAVKTPQTCQVTVNASDLMGNSDSKTLTCTIGIDDTGPAFVNISTRFVDEDGTWLLGRNGTIKADFIEAGSGLDKTNAFLDLRALGLGAEARANRCEKGASDHWTCSWDVQPRVSSGTYKVKLQPTTRDDLDNQVTGAGEVMIRYDNDAPSHARLVEIAAFRGQQRVRTNVTSLGETLEFVVQGSGYTTAVADLSDLGGGAEMPTESCEGNLTKRKCVFSMTNAISGPQGTNLSFTLSDIAGNKAIVSSSELFILGINNETSPNYWNVSARCSPTLLDRKTLSVFEHPVYCQLRMRSPNRDAVPLTVHGPLDTTECTGQTEYISSLSVENNFAGSTEPYLALSLVATDYEINNLSFTCPVSTLTRVGNFIPQNTEQDNATINLEFYNLPLGELYDNIAEEVEDVQERIDGVWDVIGDLQKFLGYAEKICQILNSIMVLITTLVTVGALLSIIGLSLKWIPVYGEAIDKALQNSSKALCNPSDTLKDIYDNELLKTLKKFCDYVTCQTGLLDATGTSYGDFTSSLYTGGQTAGSGQTVQDPSTYMNVKDSLVFSIIIPPLCIPGIIYNLDKWRQIECRYGLCLLEDVKENGLPVSVCKDQKHYMQCRFVVGEIFNLIPFAGLVSYYLNIFQQAISDPLTFVTIGLAMIINCKEVCQSGDSPGLEYEICAGLAIFSQLGQTIKIIQNYQDMTDFSLGNQFCEEFEDAHEDYEDERAQANL
jgi:hypothetical protein